MGEACGDKYASCEKDTQRACKEENPGYVDKCGNGQQLSEDRCSYDNSYGICCNTCLSGTATMYDNCKPCPNLGIYDSCPSPYTCSFEDCSNKYYPTGCKSGYVWNANDKTCNCDPAVYKYACTGTDQKGSGQTCDGKYGSCICREPYEWKNEKCYSSNKCLQGTEMGYYFYSDRTRSKELNSNKTVIGVVICSYADGGGQAAALRPTTADWTGDYTQYRNLTDQNLLPNSTSNSHNMYDSCANTKKIVELGDENLFPAA